MRATADRTDERKNPRPERVDPAAWTSAVARSLLDDRPRRARASFARRDRGDRRPRLPREREGGSICFNCRPFLARGWVARSSRGGARAAGEDANGGRSSVGVRARVTHPTARAPPRRTRDRRSPRAPRSAPAPDPNRAIRFARLRRAEPRRVAPVENATHRPPSPPSSPPTQAKFSMRNRKTRWISWRRPSS